MIGKRPILMSQFPTPRRLFDKVTTALLRTSSRHDRNQPDIWAELRSARAARVGGDLDREFEIYERICAEFPGEPAGYAARIEWLYGAARLDEAEAVGRDAMKRFPDDGWIWHWSAAVAEARGDCGAALKRWRAVHAHEAHRRHAESGVMRTLQSAGDLDRLGAVLQATNLEAEAVADLDYRCPTDLRKTPTVVGRGLVIGSCLASGLPWTFKAYEPRCETDYLLINNFSPLPEAPPHPVKAYDFQLIQIPFRSILPEYEYMQGKYDDVAAFEERFQSCCDRIDRCLELYLKWNAEFGLLTFVCNFLVPQQNPMGRLLPRCDLRNFVYFVEKLNEYLATRITAYKSVYLFDLDQITANFGRRYLQDDVVSMSGHGAYLFDAPHVLDEARLDKLGELTSYYPSRLPEIMRVVGRELEAMLRTVRQVDSVKLVLIDLDDTLWRGVLAESGSTDIEGWPLGFAEALLHLKRRGVILGIVSKNSEERITPLWSEVFRGRLNLDDFAVRKINWSPKSENISEILSEVNLLPKNVLFIDDNPVERSHVKQAFPDLRVIGANPYLWRRILLWSAETQTAGVTGESSRRSEMIKAQVEREQLRKKVSREEFLASLGVSVAISEIVAVDDPAFARALELLNKTNQFNTTGVRWTAAEALAYFESGGSFFTLTVADKFTAYGLVGVICAKPGRIDQFVMSCRVFGLDVELAMVSVVLGRLTRAAEPVTAAIVETAANQPSRDIWTRCGFQKAGEDFEFSGQEPPPIPEHISRIDKGADGEARSGAVAA